MDLRQEISSLCLKIQGQIALLGIGHLVHLTLVEPKDQTGEPMSIDHLEMLFPGTKVSGSKWCISIQGGDCSLDAYLLTLKGTSIFRSETERWVYEVIQHCNTPATRDLPEDEDAASLLTTKDLAEALGLLIGRAAQTLVDANLCASDYLEEMAQQDIERRSM